MKKRAEEAIRLAVPELQELKVGQIIEGWSGNGIIKAISDEDVVIKWNTNALTTIPLDEFDDDCVLGSDIHLEHIILANRIKQNRMSTCLSNEAEILKKYHMGKLSFTEQSEEFYKFIVDILQ